MTFASENSGIDIYYMCPRKKPFMILQKRKVKNQHFELKYFKIS